MRHAGREADLAGELFALCGRSQGTGGRNIVRGRRGCTHKARLETNRCLLRVARLVLLEVAKAVQLSGTEAGAIYVIDEQQREFRLRATYGMDCDLIDALAHADMASANQISR